MPDDPMDFVLNMLEDIIGPPPGGAEGRARTLKGMKRILLDSPLAKQATEDLLRKQPDFTCCNDPECVGGAQIEKVRAAMIERGEIVLPPPPAPAPTLSQAEADQLIADFEEAT